MYFPSSGKGLGQLELSGKGEGSTGLLRECEAISVASVLGEKRKGVGMRESVAATRDAKMGLMDAVLADFHASCCSHSKDTLLCPCFRMTLEYNLCIFSTYIDLLLKRFTLKQMWENFCHIHFSLGGFFVAQCCCGIFIILLLGDYWFISVFYVFWLYLDWETPQTGGRRSKWVRNWTVWKYFKEYFPIHVSKIFFSVLWKISQGWQLHQKLLRKIAKVCTSFWVDSWLKIHLSWVSGNSVAH